VPYHQLLLGYCELLGATFEQVADLSKDPVKALVALRQLDAIDRKYYPMIVKERHALIESIPTFPRFSQQQPAIAENPSDVKSTSGKTETTAPKNTGKATESTVAQTAKAEQTVPQFDSQSFPKTKAWLAAVAAKEFEAEKQGNAIIAKEAHAAAKAEVDKANGKPIRWTFHVRSVGESGFSIREQMSSESYLEAVAAISRHGTDHAIRVAETGVLSPIAMPAPAVFVDLDKLPQFTHERLRELRPGDPIEIVGTITDVDLKSAPTLTTFKISVGAQPKGSGLPKDSTDLKNARDAEVAERALINGIMAEPLKDAHAAKIQIAHTKLLATNVPKTPQPVFSGDGETVMYPQIQNRRLALIVANLRNHQTVTTWVPSEVPTSLWWSQDGKRLAYVSTEGKLHVVMDWSALKDVALPIEAGVYRSLSWVGPDKLACARDDTIDILDLNTLKFEPLIKPDPNWFLRDSEFIQKRRSAFSQKMNEIQSTPLDTFAVQDFQDKLGTV